MNKIVCRRHSLPPYPPCFISSILPPPPFLPCLRLRCSNPLSLTHLRSDKGHNIRRNRNCCWCTRDARALKGEGGEEERHHLVGPSDATHGLTDGCVVVVLVA